MSLIKCGSCHRQFACVVSLKAHHDYLCKVDVYLCGTNNCDRSYNDWDSYRKHLVRKGFPLRKNVVKNDATKLSETVNLDADPAVFAGEGNVDAEAAECARSPNFVLADFKSVLEETSTDLVAKILSKPGLPRCFVDLIVKDFETFLSGRHILLLRDKILELLSSCANESKEDIKMAFEYLANPFKHVSTDYLRLQHFARLGDYIAPMSYIIKKRPERVTTEQGTKWEMRSVTGQFIQVDKVLKRFMELSDVLEVSQEYIQRVRFDDVILHSFLQSEVWKRKRAKYQDDDIVFPILPYYDEVEPNAALGPHSEKIGAAYLQLPFLPPECQSQLDNILVVLLFNADDRKNYGNRRVFYPLLRLLTLLETEGVLVEKCGKTICVYFVTGVLLGDNLGLNGICGFVECFTANHPCRICRIFIDDLQLQCMDDPSLLRTRENYLEDVKRGKVSQTGIHEQCIFDDIPSFETPTDIAVDCFHDTDEGVSHYIMVEVLLHFHFLNHEFIETLNQRLYMVDLGVDKDNRPPSIVIEKLKEKKKLKMTGAEMLTFVRIFGVLVIDLVPENDIFYEMYLVLHDIVSICHAKFVPKETAEMLPVLVKELNKSYVTVCKQNLKFKFHLLTHYGRLYKSFGSIGALSTIRMEAKHRIVTMVSKTCNSRKNLPMTIAIKCQLNQCYRFRCNESIIPPLVIGSGQICELADHSHFRSFQKTLPDFFQPSAYCAKWVQYKGTTYKLKNVVITKYLDSGCPEFSEIELILSYDNSLYFVCSPLFTLGFFSEVRGYEVERFSQTSQNWFCIKEDELFDPYPLSPYTTPDGELVIIVKSFL